MFELGDTVYIYLIEPQTEYISFRAPRREVWIKTTVTWREKYVAKAGDQWSFIIPPDEISNVTKLYDRRGTVFAPDAIVQYYPNKVTAQQMYEERFNNQRWADKLKTFPFEKVPEIELEAIYAFLDIYIG